MITKEDYTYLRGYTARYYTKYYDVQLEVIDHLASMIEDIQEKNPSMGFRSALNIAYKSMPGRTFDDVIKEKEKALSKFWNKQIRSFLLQHLRWPLMIKTIALSVIIYTLLLGLSRLEFLGMWGLMVLGILLMIPFVAIQKHYIKDLQAEDKQLLSIRSYLMVSTGFWAMPLSVLVCNLHSIVGIVSFSFLGHCISAFVIAFILILEYALTVHFPKSIKTTILNKYENLIVELA